MRTPTDLELEQLRHIGVGTAVYDPVKAHKYYEEHKHLKGRQRGSTPPPTGSSGPHVPSTSKAKQKQELAARIQSLSKKLHELEALIKKKAHEQAGEDRKAKAKKERAAKEQNKPQTAAEKAKAARESEKYRKAHKQELKTKAKQASSKSGGGSSSDKKKAGSKASVSDLKALATKVRGQIAVAKQKLAAL